MDRKQRMQELILKLNEAAYAYYQTDREIMSNFEYDALYDELQKLEEESGIVLSGSPTQRVGYEVVSSLPKVEHASPMKSLDKTKDVQALAAWLGENEGILSWKLDGLTVVLTYENGTLSQAATRGNGEIGEDITPNAKVFRNIPLKIPYMGHLVVRGEALISYPDFERINQGLEEGQQYKNPRNLCSGSVRQLDSSITAQRGVYFVAYTVVESELTLIDYEDSKQKQMAFLREQGFQIVEHEIVTGKQLPEAVMRFAQKISGLIFPVDGLVVTLDSMSLSESLGSTAKFPRDSMAFKWQDEEAKTRLMEIEWSPSRTGLINPVAIFEPVELEGTTVQRASLHNVSILQDLELGIGDEITVYKANMIIPQVSQNMTRSAGAEIPRSCPRCGGETQVVSRDDVKVLMCTNPGCPAKLLKAMEHFVSRQAMNIDGLSEATLERMADRGWLQSFADLYRLKEHKEEICQMEGFGDKSCEKLLASIEESRHRELYRVLSGLGVPGIGSASAKLLAKSFGQNLQELMAADEERLSQIDGIGPVLAEAIVRFFDQKENSAMIDDLMQYVEIEEGAVQEEQTLEGKTFVITGSLEHFENRDALKELLESRGAKVAGSVSKKTSFLVNNDVESSSSKNKKAKELGIPIINEEILMEMLA